LETPPIEVWARVTDISTPFAGVLTWISRMEDLINYTKRTDLDASIAVVGGSFSRQKDWWTALVLDRFIRAHRDAFWATMNVYHAFSFLDLTVRLGSGAQRTGSLLERVQRYERRVQLLCEAGDMQLTLKRGDEAVTSYKEAIRMTDVHFNAWTHEHLQYTARAHVGMGAYDVRFGVFAQGSAYLRTAWSGVEKMLEILEQGGDAYGDEDDDDPQSFRFTVMFAAREFLENLLWTYNIRKVLSYAATITPTSSWLPE
jgi:hypothetical protein